MSLQASIKTLINNNMNEPSFLKNLITIPFITRAFYFLLIASQILQAFYQNWSSKHLASNLQVSIMHYEFWRVLTNLVFEPHLMVFFFTLAHFHVFLPKFERQNGSIILLYELITIQILIQILILGVEAFIYILQVQGFINGWSIIHPYGTVAVLVNMFFKFLFFNLKKTNTTFTKQAFVTYFYPLILVSIMCFLSKQLRLDAYLGYILAFIECVFFKGGILFYTPDTYTKKQYLVNKAKLNLIPGCLWSTLNQKVIKPNRLCVVEARQFYTFVGEHDSKVSQMQIAEEEIYTQRGVLGNSAEGGYMGEGSEEKWEKEEMVQ